jgi:hypothetical protein
MKSRKRLTIVILGALLAITPSAIRAGDDVPFKAEMSELTREFEPGKGKVLGTFTQTFEGTGTHVGKFTASGTTTLTWVGSDLWFEGEAVMVAADGDKIFSNSWGWAWDGNGEGWFEITGGTGRFEGATGSGTLIVTMSDDDVQSGVYDGRLTQ